MPMTKTKTTGAQRAAEAVQDALLTRWQIPLAAFDNAGRVRTGIAGRVQLRSASRDALNLAGASFPDLLRWLFRQTGPVTLSKQAHTMPTPQLIRLAMSRSQLRRYFPTVPPKPAGNIALSTTSGDVPALIADTMQKATSTLYAEARRSWRAWARRMEVEDFKQQDRVRLEDFDNLPEKAPGDSIDLSVANCAGLCGGG